MSTYTSLIRPILFSRDSEDVHHAALRLCQVLDCAPVRGLARVLYGVIDKRLEVSLFGLRFANPIGLAAGFDKNCQALGMLSSLGFGHIEVGSVTGEPQPGNPRPRIFRFPNDRALINRMGFPSVGAVKAAENLTQVRNRVGECVVGVNFGKSKSVPVEKAAEDYCRSFAALKELGDYFVLNVSSPNTPGLRTLQDKDKLKDLLQEVQRHNVGKKPLLVKVAPDLTYRQIDDVLDCVFACGVAGIIATNTTLTRKGLSVETTESGGLSGAPVALRARSVVSYIYKKSEGRLPIIGVGGVFSGKDAFAMIGAGASLVQIYTSLVYEGPGAVRAILKGLQGLLHERSVGAISEFVGSEAFTYSHEDN